MTAVSPFLDIGQHSRTTKRGVQQRSSLASSPPPTRPSVLSSVVPYLWRADLADDMHPSRKSPLLSLRLTSHSFLDTTVQDAQTTQALYSVRTVGAHTTVQRTGSGADANVKTAEIKWPVNPQKCKNTSDGVVIYMRGVKWKGGDSLLRRGTLLNTPRKFNIPNYSHSLRWRRVGTSWHCHTSAFKDVIVVLEESTNSSTPRVTIYETLYGRYDPRPNHSYRGIDWVCLDYILVTALLLVTDIQEWTALKKFTGSEIVIPVVSTDDADMGNAPKSAPGSISTSTSQWRKIMYGEPLYPKRSSHSSSLSSDEENEGVEGEDGDEESLMDPVPPTPLSPNTSLPLPPPSSPSIASSTLASEDDEVMFLSPSPSRPPSPSAESIFYPLTNASAPSHTYIDPSFYNDRFVMPPPPVPRLPARYTDAFSMARRGAVGSAASETVTAAVPMTEPLSPTQSGRTRGLPPVPPAAVPEQHHARGTPVPMRPQSTPPRPVSSGRVPIPDQMYSSPESGAPSTFGAGGSVVATAEQQEQRQQQQHHHQRHLSHYPTQHPHHELQPPQQYPDQQQQYPSYFSSPRRPLRQLPQPPGMSPLMQIEPLPPSVPVTMSRARSQSQSFRSSEKWSQRMLPSPPTSGSTSSASPGSAYTYDHHSSRHTSQLHNLHHYRSQQLLGRGDASLVMMKDPEEDFSDWVHSLTTIPHGAPAVPLSNAAFDVPPPAYNSIDFQTSRRIGRSGSPPPPPPPAVGLGTEIGIGSPPPPPPSPLSSE